MSHIQELGELFKIETELTNINLLWNEIEKQSLLLEIKIKEFLCLQDDLSKKSPEYDRKAVETE